MLSQRCGPTHIQNSEQFCRSMCKDTTFKRILKEQEAMDEVEEGKFHD